MLAIRALRDDVLPAGTNQALTCGNGSQATPVSLYRGTQTIAADERWWLFLPYVAVTI